MGEEPITKYKLFQYVRIERPRNTYIFCFKGDISEMTNTKPIKKKVHILSLSHQDSLIDCRGDPGLVVTRASCYSCVFSKTRREQEFSVISDEKNSNQLCTRNLEIIYGNKKKLWSKDRFLHLRVILLHFRKFTLRQKYPTKSGN